MHSSLISKLPIAVVIIVGALLATTGKSQGPATPPTPRWQIDAGGTANFDVASVKQDTADRTPQTTYANIPLDGRDLFVPTGGLFFAANQSLSQYITFAYKLASFQWFSIYPQMPKWSNTVRFDIQARASGSPTKDQFRLMMQALLADRFKLSVHWETRPLPVFALVLDKSEKLGPRLRRHSEEHPCSTAVPVLSGIPKTIPGGFPEPCGTLIYWADSGRDHAGGRDMTMDVIASQANGTLVDTFDRPVIDKTGLVGKYDFIMDYTPQFNGPPPAGFQVDESGPTYLEALKNQLGIRLELTKGRVQVLVIDHIEAPSPN